MKLLSIILKEEYDWEEALNNPIDVTTSSGLELEESTTFSELKTHKVVNVYKAVYDEDLEWYDHIDSEYSSAYFSHFGTFPQAKIRMEIMEEDDWHIYKVSLNLNKLYPKLLVDSGAGWDESKVRTHLLKEGFNVGAYINTAEGNSDAGENLSLIVLDSKVVL